MTGSGAAKQGSALCADCGLCCDGTLFARARVQPEFARATSELGFQVTPHGERLAFTLPCARLDGTCCTMYETRPMVCRTFRCATLMELEAGTVTLDAARAAGDSGDLVARASLELALRVLQTQLYRFRRPQPDVTSG